MHASILISVAVSTAVRTQSHEDSVRKATVEEQLNSKTNRPAMRAQLHLPALDLSWALLASFGSHYTSGAPATDPLRVASSMDLHYTWLSKSRTQGSRRDQKIRRSRGGRWSWTFKLAQKRSLMSREMELGCESWTSFASSCCSTAVQRTLSL